jgi:tetratricopeptide (TPR) repeat protein/glycosyltransferase involved in cell wall biosynthesis
LHTESGLESNRLAVVFFATHWGSKDGGVNTFNYHLCQAFAEVLDGETICIVLGGSAAQTSQLRLSPSLRVITLPVDRGLVQSFDPLSALNNIDIGNVAVWFGHDTVTGEFSVHCAAALGGTCAIFHHMNFEAYYHLKKPPFDVNKKVREQRELLKKADMLFAVGHKLARSASDCAGAGRTAVVMPGLYECAYRTDPAGIFRVLVSGRLAKEDEKVKRGRLAAAGFCEFTKTHGPESYAHDCKLVLLGCESKDLDATRAEVDLIKSAYSDRSVNIVVEEFIDDPAEVMEKVQGYSAVVMSSQHEGFGLVGWEAISTAVPLIVTKNSGLYESLEKIDSNYINYVYPVDIKGTEDDQFRSDDITAIANALALVAKDSSASKSRALKLRRLLFEMEVLTWTRCASDVCCRLGLPNSSKAETRGTDQPQVAFSSEKLPVAAQTTPSEQVDDCATYPLQAELDAIKKIMEDSTLAARALGHLAELDSVLPPGDSTTEPANLTLSKYYTLKGQANFLLGEYRRAGENYLSAARFRPLEKTSIANAISAQFFLGKPEAALAEARRLASEFPDYKFGTLKLVECLLDAGLTNEAKGIVEGLPADETDADVLFMKARYFEATGDYQEAESAVSLLLKRKPTDVVSLMLKARICDARGRRAWEEAGRPNSTTAEMELHTAAALATLRQALLHCASGSKRYAELLATIAFLHFKLGDKESAKQLALAADELLPQLEHTRVVLGMLAFKNDDYATALSWLGPLQTPHVIEAKIICNLELGAIDTARNLLQQLTESGPSDAHSAWMNIVFCIKSDDRKAADRRIEEFKSKFNLRLSENLAYLCHARELENRHSDVVALIDVHGGPSEEWHRNILLFYCRAKWELQEYEALVWLLWDRRGKIAGSLFYWLALSLAETSRAGQLLQLYNDERSKFSPHALLAVAKVYEEIGDLAAALAVYQKLSHLDKDNMRLRLTIEHLEVQLTGRAVRTELGRVFIDRRAGAPLAGLATLLLREGEVDLATHYAYEALRLSPHVETCHMALVWATQFGDPEHSSPRVTEKSSVELTTSSGTSTWYTIEEIEPCDPLKNELHALSTQAQAMLGRKVGDTVVWPTGSGDQNFVVTAIGSKYALRAAEVADRYPASFPEGRGFFKIPVGQLEQITAENIARRDRIQALARTAELSPIQLCALSDSDDLIGSTLFIHGDRLCRKSIAARYPTAMQPEIIRRLKSLQFDFLSLVILADLKLLDKVSRIPHKILVPSFVMDEVWQHSSEFIESKLQRMPDEQRKLLLNIHHFVNARCVRQPSVMLLKLTPNVRTALNANLNWLPREQLVSAVGSAGLVYSDGFQFKVAGVQPVLDIFGCLEYLAWSGLISTTKLAEAKGRLVDLGYRLTSYTVDDFRTWKKSKSEVPLDFLYRVYEINLHSTPDSVVDVLCQLLIDYSRGKEALGAARYYLQPLFRALLKQRPHLQIFLMISDRIDVTELTDRQLEKIFDLVSTFIHVPPSLSDSHPIFRMPLLRFLWG